MCEGCVVSASSDFLHLPCACIPFSLKTNCCSVLSAELRLIHEIGVKMSFSQKQMF